MLLALYVIEWYVCTWIVLNLVIGSDKLLEQLNDVGCKLEEMLSQHMSKTFELLYKLVFRFDDDKHKLKK